MADLVKFDPFGDSFETALRRMLRPMWRDAEFDMKPDIKVDVAETNDAYTVKAELPGVKKEDIDVRIEGNAVSIGAETKREKEVKEGSKVIRSERYYGSLYRAFTLGQEVDSNAAAANYSDGVLTLTLPKRPGGERKKIAIK